MARKVGYGNPPEHARWRKGQSGNPSGRPKKRPNFMDDLLTEMAEVIQVTESGKVRKITKQRALIKALTAGGIKGNARAASLLMAWCARAIEANPELQTPTEMSDADRKIVEDYLDRQVQLRLAQRKEGE
jgi:hypothetical protein